MQLELRGEGSSSLQANEQRVPGTGDSVAPSAPRSMDCSGFTDLTCTVQQQPIASGTILLLLIALLAVVNPKITSSMRRRMGMGSQFTSNQPSRAGNRDRHGAKFHDLRKKAKRSNGGRSARHGRGTRKERDVECDIEEDDDDDVYYS